MQCNALYTSQYEKKTFFDGKEKETATELRTFSKKRWNVLLGLMDPIEPPL